MKKCAGESGESGDIAKNVKIAMQKIVGSYTTTTDKDKIEQQHFIINEGQPSSINLKQKTK